jgi:uncharacterized membrane protein
MQTPEAGVQTTKPLKIMQTNRTRYSRQTMEDTELAGDLPFLTLKDSSPQVANGFINLYRAEISNMAAYRTRLDTSMNWAVSMTGERL